MQRALSFDAMPPLAVPLRFFVAAPAFATAAGLLLAWQGGAAFATRWGPGALAATHLLVLGFLAMVMCGALLQMLPVVGGVDIAAPRMTGLLCFGGLALGTPLLAAAFLGAGHGLFPIAAGLLGMGFAVLLGASARGLLRRAPLPAAPTVNGMRLAFAGLGATAALGMLLAGGLAWGLPLPFVGLVQVHAGLGLVGWVAMLVMGVSFQVIPMFQATPPYPAAYARWAPAALGAALVPASVALHDATAPAWLALPLLASLACFAVLTLRLLARRRRPQGDPTTRNWRLSMACLLGCCALAMLPADRLPLGITGEQRAFLLGVLFIAGVAMPVVNGMLYKIVPFLLWYHLQEAVGVHGKPPSIRLLFSEPDAMHQFYLQAAALPLLAAAVFVPALARVGGLALALASLHMLANLFGAVRAYQRARTPPASALVGA